jgi:hypothetical protein
VMAQVTITERLAAEVTATGLVSWSAAAESGTDRRRRGEEPAEAPPSAPVLRLTQQRGVA